MRWLLVGTLLATVVCCILVTPLGGFETRAPADTYPAGFAAVGVFFIGVILDVIAAVQLARRKAKAPLLAAIGGALFFPVVIVEKLGFFSAHEPPPTIQALEYLGATFALVSIIVAVVLKQRSNA